MGIQEEGQNAMNQYNELAISLTTRNVVPSDAPIFHAAYSGDVERLKLLFGSRESSPNDVEAVAGRTALHVSSSREGVFPVNKCRW